MDFKDPFRWFSQLSHHSGCIACVLSSTGFNLLLRNGAEQKLDCSVVADCCRSGSGTGHARHKCQNTMIWRRFLHCWPLARESGKVWYKSQFPCRSLNERATERVKQHDNSELNLRKFFAIRYGEPNVKLSCSFCHNAMLNSYATRICKKLPLMSLVCDIVISPNKHVCLKLHFV